ncbi:MAG: hypothetical protein Q8906_04170 [Bacillota bacterium]|nr:hypothetical protein [Bacillota bacterium]MDP4169783.1 hypothetical protein [Bacillota bacterium]
MNNETYIDFCFMKKGTGEFLNEIEALLKELFRGKRLNWYLEEKAVEDAWMVVAEIKGMSDWKSEEEAIMFIEDTAPENFWKYLQGYKLFVYPASKGCNSCGTY